MGRPCECGLLAQVNVKGLWNVLEAVKEADAARLATGVRIIQTPFSIFCIENHERNMLSGVWMTVPPRPGAARGAHRLLRDGMARQHAAPGRGSHQIHGRGPLAFDGTAILTTPCIFPLRFSV